MQYSMKVETFTVLFYEIVVFFIVFFLILCVTTALSLTHKFQVKPITIFLM